MNIEFIDDSCNHNGWWFNKTKRGHNNVLFSISNTMTRKFYDEFTGQHDIIFDSPKQAEETYIFYLNYNEYDGYYDSYISLSDEDLVLTSLILDISEYNIYL
jgi:hypothetical protein